MRYFPFWPITDTWAPSFIRLFDLHFLRHALCLEHNPSARGWSFRMGSPYFKELEKHMDILDNLGGASQVMEECFTGRDKVSSTALEIDSYSTRCPSLYMGYDFENGHSQGEAH